MAEPLAVLSYTRKDDDHFGGYISAFRKTLESAVHVVTGKEDFQLFQDIEGIVLGEKWEKKLAEVINSASFLVPMVSPLFLNSKPCRAEVSLFLAHERALHRDDLILPVYFFTSPKLEKEEERQKDELVAELSKRQMYDWRENANIPLQEPAARKEMIRLANAVAEAIERLESSSTETKERAAGQRAERELEAEAGVIDALGATKREPLSERVVLWVDDLPGNNVWERRALEAYGMRFRLATSTAEGEELLRTGDFSAIISDMSRPGDRRAGYTLLEQVRTGGRQTPYFIYTASRSASRIRDALRRGAQGLTNDPDELVAMVVAAVR
jgi:CheY-like chemotaxis protein